MYIRICSSRGFGLCREKDIAIIIVVDSHIIAIASRFDNACPRLNSCFSGHTALTQHSKKLYHRVLHMHTRYFAVGVI